MATIKEVAEYAGVSITSVSHVINHPERVSETMRERVEKAILDLGYNPNPNARSLRTGRSNLIALLIPDICSPFFSQLVQTIQTEVSKLGLDTVIYNTDVPGGMAKTHVAEYLTQIGQHRFDGLIVAEEALLGHTDILPELNLATVFIGNLEVQPLVDTIIFDDYTAAYQVTGYLIDKGHRRIAHITGELDFHSACERYRGFRQVLEDHSLPIEDDLIYHGTYLRPAGRKGIRYLLEHSNPPTAVFIANSQMAISALATIYDMGKRVPEDIAIVTIDYDAHMEDVRPTLTTIDYNPVTLGHLAVTQLFERLEGNSSDPPRSLNVPFTLLARNSA